ncbi:Guanine nucleotide-binding protein subunit beta [Cocos nucifera]|uniref:Guanine nucleotide-binding protein subunit beta n=1 Tax=Cocos nucifera TaxID=13894 RepID=A0A8K0NC47_COCNU|nr:Guanine nucleotide-binding protein subunit beta [Cocos nucifera]
MSVADLKERHIAATATVNALRERLKQRRQALLDTDVAGYAKGHGKTAIGFGSTDLVYSLDWTPERNRIVSASQDGRLIVWNALTSQKTHAIKLHCAWVMTCAFAPNGQSVACGGLDSACSIFNLNSQVDRDGNIPISRILTGHKGYVSSCQFVPDQETRLITGSGDQTCVLWDVTTGQRISVFGGEFPSGHTADVLSVSINSSNSNMFVSGSCDATARLWDTRIASRAVRTYHGHEGDVNAVKFFPDGQRFGTGSDDGTCRLFDMRTGHQLQIYSQQHDNNDNDVAIVTSIAFSISGRLLFAGYSNGDCYVWDTLVAEVVLNLGTLQNSHEGRISCLVQRSCSSLWLLFWVFGYLASVATAMVERGKRQGTPLGVGTVPCCDVVDAQKSIIAMQKCFPEGGGS